MNTDRSGRRGVGWVLAIFVLSTVLPSLGLLLGTPAARAACAAPCVELLSPNGGEDLTGGSAPALTVPPHSAPRAPPPAGPPPPSRPPPTASPARPPSPGSPCSTRTPAGARGSRPRTTPARLP